jgi:hypothetical protein
MLNNYDNMFDDLFGPEDGGEFSELDRQSNELFINRLEIMLGGEVDPTVIPQPDTATVPFLVEEINQWWCNN